MKGLTIRFLKAKSLLDYNELEEPTFKNGFKKEELSHNKHYYNRDEKVVVQVNDAYKHIDCHKTLFQSQIAHPTTKEDMLVVIKNIVNSGADFYLTSLEDECEDYLDEQKLTTLDTEYDTKESYLARLEEEFEYDSIFSDLYTITINTDDARIYFYRGGTISYSPDGHNIPSEKEYEAIINYLGSFTPLLKEFKTLEKIEMSEKKRVKHPLSDFHLLVDYAKENKDSLPKDLQEALKNGLEKEITELSNTHKNKDIYGK